MDKLQTYEFAGTICPGAVVIYGLSRIYPEIGLLAGGEKLEFGEFGLLLILAYVTGHLLQAFGNLIEKIYWFCWGGMPTDWPRSGVHYLIAPQQASRLSSKVKDVLKIDCPENLKNLNRKDWNSITWQIFATVKKAGQAERVDIFNGIYGLLRGVSSGALVLVAAASVKSGLKPISLYFLLFVVIILAIYRMHRFGVRFARELFVQFLNMKPEEENNSKQDQAA